MANGIDCSKPLTFTSASALAAQGYRFAARYLVPAGYTWKRLTRDEAEAITAAGLQIVSVFETNAQRASSGALAGQVDGALAYREAKLINQPAGSAVYLAVDYDARPDDYDAIEAYLKAATAEMPGYRTGVYGSYGVIEEMARRRACRHFWQTYAWSRGQKSRFANLYQYKNNVNAAGISVDLNQSYGQEGWWDADQKAMHSLGKADADAMILIFQAAWQAADSQAEKDELHRLANVLRQASGQAET